MIPILQKVNKQVKIKTLITYNGKEFSNKSIKRWCEDEGVKHEFSIPYYHASNGRVERVNRTIRDAIKKVKGILKVKLKKITNNYNNSFHRGIKMTPNEALFEKNRSRVLESQEQYEKEFIRKKSKSEEKEMLFNQERT